MARIRFKGLVPVSADSVEMTFTVSNMRPELVTSLSAFAGSLEQAVSDGRIDLFEAIMLSVLLARVIK